MDFTPREQALYPALVIELKRMAKTRAQLCWLMDKPSLLQSCLLAPEGVSPQRWFEENQWRLDRTLFTWRQEIQILTEECFAQDTGMLAQRDPGFARWRSEHPIISATRPDQAP